MNVTELGHIWRIYGPIRPARYLEDHDDDKPLTTWISQRCKMGKHYASLLSLYTSYTTWCLEESIEPLGKTTLGRRLDELGFHRCDGLKVFFVGIGFKTEPEELDKTKMIELKRDREEAVTRATETFIEVFCVDASDELLREFHDQMRYRLGSYQVSKEEFVRRLGGRLVRLKEDRDEEETF